MRLVNIVYIVQAEALLNMGSGEGGTIGNKDSLVLLVAGLLCSAALAWLLHSRIAVPHQPDAVRSKALHIAGSRRLRRATARSVALDKMRATEKRGSSFVFAGSSTVDCIKYSTCGDYRAARMLISNSGKAFLLIRTMSFYS